GNPKLAELLAVGAIRAGADAVKYQLVFADELAVPDYAYYNLFKSLEMETAVWEHVVELIRLDHKKVYFDVYGDKSLDLAQQLGASGVKISTTDFYNTSLVKKAIASFKQVFISMGGIPIEEVDELIRNVKMESHVTFMYGFQAEPTQIEDNNLLRIPEIKKRYPQMPIGFMDHTLGSADEALYLPIMAMSLGATCIEKHITLDPVLQIEDYISALEPCRFGRFVQTIRTMEKALGRLDLILTPKEKEYRNKAGKVVVAKRDLKIGEIVKETDLALKRVKGGGTLDCFRRISEVLGKQIAQDVPINYPITKGVL
ncbi:MAG: N-acetylneuraminate synthase family protein, partial [Thermodesulfobacteriota bacterium]